MDILKDKRGGAWLWTIFLLYVAVFGYLLVVGIEIDDVIYNELSVDFNIPADTREFFHAGTVWGFPLLALIVLVIWTLTLEQKSRGGMR